MSINILKVNIKRFRSINDLTLNISKENNIISICGQNNVGKTNILRAINMFFDKTEFCFKEDVPEFKQKTAGASVYPIVTIDFHDSKNNLEYSITKDYDIKNIEEDSITPYLIKGKKDNIEIDGKECVKLINSLNIFYLPSINLSFPEIINILIDDKFLDIEFGNTSMRGKKKQVKDSLEDANATLQAILDDLTDSINPSFKDFHESWGIKFVVPKNINRFRELITNEVEFAITDDTQCVIKSKGAGLQRLGHILITLRIIEKLSSKKKNCILLIDEPDIYLHASLQRKLKEKLVSISKNAQVFLTTHSSIFINPYNLNNLFLLKLDVEEKYSVRKKETGRILNTTLMDLHRNDAIVLIKETLGIEDKDSLLIAKRNLLVEGKEDEKYISELIKVFDLPNYNIIPAGGVTNFKPYLEYYNSMTDIDSTQKPLFKVLFDNDEAGRSQYDVIDKKIKGGSFKNIEVKIEYVKDCFNSDFSKIKNPKPNIEIEDLIYPEIILELSNRIFTKKKGIKKLRESIFNKKVQNLSLRYNGVLSILDNMKNEVNIEDGLTFSTKDVSFKGGLAGQFNIVGDTNFIEKIITLDKKYPFVKEFLTKLLKE
jgi:predicted ATP-dependent endonuclease of OLD family